MSKRILIVGQHFWPESFRINDIADYFVEQGCEVDVLCGLPNYPKGEFMEGYGYLGKRHELHNKVYIDRVLEIKRGNNSNFRIFLNYVSFPFFSLFHIPKLLVRRYDHVFIYQLSPVMMSVAGIVVGKLKHVPITMYVLDLWPENLYSVIPLKNKVLRTIAEKHSHWYYRKAGKLIALSERMREKLSQVSNKELQEILVLPQACEKIYEQRTHDEALRKRFSKTFNIVFTGNISPAQSFETMTEAARLLKEKGYKDMQWIIVGDGMSRKNVEKQVIKMGLSDIFVFEGQHPIDDMPKYADIADLFVGCLAKSELLESAIPAKVVSYLALEKPIVLAMDGEVQSLINNVVKCGFASAAENASALAANIEIIYSLPASERAKMGERAFEYYTTKLERSVLMKKLYSFISHDR